MLLDEARVLAAGIVRRRDAAGVLVGESAFVL
jgi:hypothetical protein